MDENTQIVKSIRDRQEEKDAKLENLTIDVHSMQGVLTALTESVLSNKYELEFISRKTYLNEMEIFNLRRSSFENKTK
ncbi:hypothetical protein [Sporosarcina sp. FA9]|uniref:hypothetical protein n=1 Tax=Sporosarcina sp. FA9 TaxID=3413030 RepID=UPI003F657ECA